MAGPLSQRNAFVAEPFRRGKCKAVSRARRSQKSPAEMFMRLPSVVMAYWWPRRESMLEYACRILRPARSDAPLTDIRGKCTPCRSRQTIDVWFLAVRMEL